jgi:hypothetical protein
MMTTAMNHSLKPGQKLGTARVAPKIKAQRIFLSHKMAVKAQASDSDAKTTVSHGFDVNALALAAAMPTAWLVSEGAFRVRPHSHPLASTRVHSRPLAGNAPLNTRWPDTSLYSTISGSIAYTYILTDSAARHTYPRAAPALAIGREYGIIEGQIMSLMHPAFMFGLLAASLYAGYLGFQWRRARELVTEIKDLKAQLPKPAEGETAPPSPLDATIKGLEAERKALIGQKLNEKHHNWGSLILGLGTLMAISGPTNTFLRTGKLFPGPHLYAGAGMVVLWAAAAALVPSMQKGNDTSRSLHIGMC